MKKQDKEELKKIRSRQWVVDYALPILIIIIVSYFLISATLNKIASTEKRTISDCINQSGTNVIGTENIEQCKLFLCLINSDNYNNLVNRNDIIKCENMVEKVK